MEKNTILLGIDEYNILRDFKKEIEVGNTMVICWSYGYNESKFISTDEAVKQIAEINAKLKKEIEEFNESKLPKDFSIERIKKMGYWSLIKWKFNLKK